MLLLLFRLLLLLLHADCITCERDRFTMCTNRWCLGMLCLPLLVCIFATSFFLLQSFLLYSARSCFEVVYASAYATRVYKRSASVRSLESKRHNEFKIKTPFGSFASRPNSAHLLGFWSSRSLCHGYKPIQSDTHIAAHKCKSTIYTKHTNGPNCE